MHNAFTWSSIIAGFLSGALWFYASGIKVPTNLVSGFNRIVAFLPLSLDFDCFPSGLWVNSTTAAIKLIEKRTEVR